jgi:radical SAM protein with 4Fe4S-binding SPASM domain
LYATGHAGSGQGTKTMVLSRYVGGCGAGRCYCAIQPNGDVTPCVYVPNDKVGSLKTQPLREVWDCALFAVLSDRSGLGGHCGVCDYQAYCGGCRARALAYTSDIRNGDPGCRYNEKLWEQIARQTVREDLVQIASAGAAQIWYHSTDERTKIFPENNGAGGRGSAVRTGASV